MWSGLTDEYRMIINKAFAAFKVQWLDAPWTERKPNGGAQLDGREPLLEQVEGI